MGVLKPHVFDRWCTHVVNTNMNIMCTHNERILHFDQKRNSLSCRHTENICKQNSTVVSLPFAKIASADDNFWLPEGILRKEKIMKEGWMTSWHEEIREADVFGIRSFVEAWGRGERMWQWQWGIELHGKGIGNGILGARQLGLLSSFPLAASRIRVE